MELPSSYNVNKNVVTTATLLAIALILIILLNQPLLKYTTPSLYHEEDVKISSGNAHCDIFNGEWIPNPDAPYYTNKTCWAIHEHQNCMKYGRPDTEFLKWRWKPYECELQVFDPFEFLDLVRDSSMAFVGDSVGRNQMQSMICLLSRVEYPIDVSHTTNDQFKHWKYVTYNFTIASFWTPFLVRANERDSDGPTHTGLFNLYLDEPETSWITEIDEFDYIILNAGHWFSRPAVFYEQHRMVSCHFCQLPNLTDLPMTYSYRRAIRTALKAINSRKDFKGVTYLRTYAPSHFENGFWNNGGNCIRKRPFMNNETILEGLNLDLYMIQLEEFRVADREGDKELRLLDTTQAMLLRPDGHPSKYGHWPNENVTLYNDCVHWCLPGPIDSWADFLAHMMKMERRKVDKEKRYQQQFMRMQ